MNYLLLSITASVGNANSVNLASNSIIRCYVMILSLSKVKNTFAEMVYARA
ncbi:MAG: hypothetical protein ABR968_11325 [Bacteroidales bacterium]